MQRSSRSTRPAAILAALCLAVVLQPTVAPAQTVTITIEHYLFDPVHVEIPFGTPVTWRNNESGPVPLNPAHNVIRDQYIAPGEVVPQIVTQRICNAFEPGQSCSLTATQSKSLLPKGRHLLTCTIDRDHAVLMHAIIDVV